MIDSEFNDMSEMAKRVAHAMACKAMDLGITITISAKCDRPPEVLLAFAAIAAMREMTDDTMVIGINEALK